jgi:hypothetical protein
MLIALFISWSVASAAEVGSASIVNKTMCCNWRSKPDACGIGICTKTDCSWLCKLECQCSGAGWIPDSWQPEISASSLLPGSPDVPGGVISNGYVGAFVPRMVPGSAGSPVCGVEHVKGFFTTGSTPQHLHPDSGAANSSYSVSLAPMASWTSTSFISSISTTKLPATASAMDFRRAAYKVASRAEGVECVQTIYAHRSKPHLLIADFDCTNHGIKAATVTIDQGRCNPSNTVDDYIYSSTLCPQTGARNGYDRQRKAGLSGVICSLSTATHSETPTVAVPVLGECHTEVPAGGVAVSVAAGETRIVTLISARYSNMDDGPRGNSADVVAQARQEWIDANTTGSGALYAAHEAAMDELHEVRIDPLGP